MGGDLELAVRRSKRLEGMLERRFGARGRGLHEKITSVAPDLPEQTVRDLRLVATVRNRIVHEEVYDRIEGRAAFREACRRAERALTPRRRRRWMVWLALGAILLFGVLALMQGESPIRVVPGRP